MPKGIEMVFVVGPLSSAPPPSASLAHREMEPHAGMGLGAARGPGGSQIRPRRLRMTSFKGRRAVCADSGRGIGSEWLPADRALPP